MVLPFADKFLNTTLNFCSTVLIVLCKVVLSFESVIEVISTNDT